MTIVIADEDRLTSDLLAKICKSVLGHEIIGMAHDGEEAIGLIQRLKPDLVLLELELSKPGGFGVIAAIKRMDRVPRIVVLSRHLDGYTVHRVERDSIQGFVDKTVSLVDDLNAALLAVSEGKTYFSETVNKKSLALRLASDSFVKLLTEHQQSILEYIGDLHGDEEISKALGISVRTVERHRGNIMHGLGLGTRTELEQYARRHGFTRGLG